MRTRHLEIRGTSPRWLVGLSLIGLALAVCGPASASDYATPWVTQKADAAVPDGPPAGIYTVVPFELSRAVIEGDHGTDAEREARAGQWNDLLLSGLETRLADAGVKRAGSMAEATGLVLTGEFLLVDAGSGAGRLSPGGQYGAGQADIYVVVRVVDAAAPETTLYEFYAYGFNQDSAGYAVTSIVMEAIPKAIAKALKKPSKSKAKKGPKKKLEELREKQVEAHGPAK